MTVSNGCGEKLVFKRLILHDIEHENVENAAFSQCGTPITLSGMPHLSSHPIKLSASWSLTGGPLKSRFRRPFLVCIRLQYRLGVCGPAVDDFILSLKTSRWNNYTSASALHRAAFPIGQGIGKQIVQDRDGVLIGSDDAGKFLL